MSVNTNYSYTARLLAWRGILGTLIYWGRALEMRILGTLTVWANSNGDIILRFRKMKINRDFTITNVIWKKRLANFIRLNVLRSRQFYQVYIKFYFLDG